MSLQTKKFYEFANFRLDLSEKTLLRDGKPVQLTPKVFETLRILTENAGHLIEKDELIRKIWQDRFVDECNLVFNVKILRKALGDDATAPRFIETVSCRGYRFIAAVKRVSEENYSENKFTADNLPANVERRIFQPTKQRFFLPFFIALIILIGGAFAAGLWYSHGRASASVLSAPVAFEKLSASGTVACAVVSPDGKKVVYLNGIGGDKESVWLRQLETGSSTEIIAPSDDMYGGLAFAPDGNYFYFARRPRNLDEQFDIYRIPVFGGIPQKIIDAAQGWMSVSPDGAKISFVRCPHRNEENCSLWIADTLDGANERKLAARPRPFRIGDNRFAPDGKSVAFAVGQSENQSNEFGLAEINLETGAERELSGERFFNIKNLVWLPDKSGLLITASRVPNKNLRVWRVDFDKNDAVPLTNDSENYADLNLDKDADELVATQVKEDFHLRILPAENPAAGRVLANASTVSFAPDGRILFSSPMSGNDEIWSINADGKSQKQLTNNTAYECSPVASADNNSIYFASNRSGSIQVWQMNADGGNQTQITRKEGGFPIFVSPDGEWIYYHHGISRTLWRVSAKTGEEQPVLKKANYDFALSPDGRQAAFAERQGEGQILTVVSLADGRVVKNFHPTDKTAHFENIAFMPDGKSLAYIITTDNFENGFLWIQPISDKPPRQVVSFSDAEANEDMKLAVSYDGKAFAIIQGGWRHDAVLIKGLK